MITEQREHDVKSLSLHTPIIILIRISFFFVFFLSERQANGQAVKPTESQVTHPILSTSRTIHRLSQHRPGCLLALFCFKRNPLLVLVIITHQLLIQIGYSQIIGGNLSFS